MEVESSDCKKLLGIKIISKFNSKDHLDEIVKRASRKIKVLTPI